MKSVSIIIVNYNLTDNVRCLLQSIVQFVNNIDYEVIVVDNNSPDRSIEKLSTEFPHFRFEFLNTNNGFGHGNNVGVSLTTGKYLLLLNPDTYLTENLPLKLFDFSEQHLDFGIIGPQLNYPDGSFQISMAKFPNLKQEIAKVFGILGKTLTILHKFKSKVHKENFYKVDFVFGSCMFIRRKLFEEVLGFDENYFLIIEETDLCYDVKKRSNYSVVYWYEARVRHLKSQITGKNLPLRIKQEYESKLRFFSKHYSRPRRELIKWVIICIFALKYLKLFRKGGKSKLFKETYKFIVKLYLHPPILCPKKSIIVKTL